MKKIQWRRLWQFLIFCAIIAFWSEQRSCVTPAMALPPAVAQWSISGPQSCGKSASPKLRPLRGTSGARQVCQALYHRLPDGLPKGLPDASPEITLTVYDLPGWPGATAFGAYQDWLGQRKQPGQVTFHGGKYFGVVESTEADAGALDRFAAAAAAALPYTP